MDGYRHQRPGFCPSGRIGLLTQLRWFGHLQNPVSFYYCWDSSDSRVEAVVAEVTNTPWRERHCYVIDLRRRSDECGNRRPVTQKELHVSPFLPMDLSYQWRFRQPGQSLSVHVSDLHGQSCVFKASLVLRRRRITTGNLAQIFVKYPFITARVTSGIYWHALRLWWKKAVFHTHPARAV